MCFLLVLPSSRVFAAAGPTLRTTLSDNTTQRGSKKTFDVWARNASGEKIKATVTFNGEKLSPTWDDNEKSSYTLNSVSYTHLDVYKRQLEKSIRKQAFSKL